MDVFYEKYFHMSVRQKETEFLDLVQGNGTVAAYEAKFTEFARFAPYIVANEPTRARKFLRGLRPNIRTRLRPFLLTQHSDVVNRALVVKQDTDDYQKVQEQKKRTIPFKSPKVRNLVVVFRGTSQRDL